MRALLGRIILGTSTLLACHLAKGEVIRVFVIAGQSNAIGSGASADGLPPAVKSPQADVRFWFDEGPLGAVTNQSIRTTSGGEFVALQHQLDPTQRIFDTGAGFGPEIMVGRALADGLPAPVAVIKFAFNATSLDWHWDPERAGSLYSELIGVIETAMDRLAADGHTGRLTAVFWLQGEADAWSSASVAERYEANLAGFIEHLRVDLVSADLPFIFGRLHRNVWKSPYGITPANLATIRAAQEAVAAAVPHVCLVDTDNLTLIADSVHFDASGELMIGARFAAAYLATLPPVAGDLDGNRAVDRADADLLETCTSGPAIPYDPWSLPFGCNQLADAARIIPADLDRDRDVDQSDFGILQRNLGNSVFASEPPP